MFFRSESKAYNLTGRLLSGTDFRRKSLKPRTVRDAPEPRTIARHGSMLILEVRDERGRKALRYVTEVSNNG